MNSIIRTFILCLLLASPDASAAILWAGGEDMDFSYGNAPCATSTTGIYRTGYARRALRACASGEVAISAPFAIGALTSAWVSARVYFASPYVTYTSERLFGVGKTLTGHSLWVGTNSSNENKLTLYKYNGSSLTALATESGISLSEAQLHKIDMEIVNFGASATVRVYVNGNASPIITYTGDVTSGSASFDDIRIGGAYSSSGGSNWMAMSELIVSDSDTRNLSVVTLSPSAAGSTNDWTGSFSDVNESPLNDDTTVYSSTSGQTFQCNVNDLPTGSFAIHGLRISARATKSGSTVNGISLGVLTNSSTHSPAASSLINAYNNIQHIYQNTNPVTSSPWTTSDINNLQFNLQSAP